MNIIKFLFILIAQLFILFLLLIVARVSIINYSNIEMIKERIHKIELKLEKDDIQRYRDLFSPIIDIDKE
jgi:hypothetical protein